MSNISFRLCKKIEKEDLLDFIKCHWSQNHVFLNSSKLLDWQHLNEEKKYNFWIAIEEKSKKILGILGFIPTYHFSQKLINQKTFWLAIWKVDEKLAPPGLGVMLLKTLVKHLKADVIIGSGISDISKRFYKLLKYEIGSLSHFFLVNPKKNKFKILKKPKNFISNIQNKEEYKLIKIDKNNLFEKCTKNEANIFVSTPKKNTEFIFNRYLNLPFYKYKIFGFSSGKEVSSLVVLREVFANNSKVLRLIDFQGNESELAFIIPNFVNMLVREDYEYLDFIQTGISKDFLKDIGFEDLSEHNEVVLPNYFEPFTQENTIIDFCFKNFSDDRKINIFKGDSDQDRPNLIP